MPRISLPGYRDLEPTYRNNSTRGYSAVRESDGRRVMLKCLVPGSSDARARWRLGYESQILSQLSIWGVVRTHGIEMSAHGPVLVVDDVGGTPLAHTPGDLPSLPAFLDVAVRLARIVAELHAAGVCHGDITPMNVVRNLESGEVFLVGFGHATRSALRPAVTPADRPGGPLGFPEKGGYSNPPVDRRADLYAVGGTLFEFLVGRRPFESANPLALVDASFARAPFPAHKLRPDVPPMLSAILGRLLAAEVEDRYQHAGALAEDLDRCRIQFQESGGIGWFELSTTDRRGVFSLPDRLVGRGAATLALEGVLRRAREGASASIGISGPPGVGKTALSHELLRRLGGAGIMVTGVCIASDHTPYAPIFQIVTALASQLLDGPRDHLEFHRTRFLRALEGDRNLLLRLMPELEPLIGGSVSFGESMPGDGRARIVAMFVRVLRACHEPATPLVLFVDDVHWADHSSLAVLDRLLHGDGVGGPAVLMAWRDGEVGPGHPLPRLLRAPVEPLVLGSLDVSDTADLIAGSMGPEPEDVAELARIVHEKTSGNPFFIRELLASLVADGLVAFDPASVRWVWSLEAIGALPPTRNVAELLGRQLAALPEPVLRVLGVAACIGKRFDIGVLAWTAELEVPQLCSALHVASRVGLIVGSTEAMGLLESVVSGAAADASTAASQLFAVGALRFVHDEVHAAALALVSEPARSQLHLRAGRMLLDRWRAEGGSPFAAADHFHAALSLLTDPGDRRTLAELHLAAGRHAADSLAFPAALHYLETGVRALGPAAWEESPELAYALHIRGAEVAWMCPEQPTTIDFVADGLRRSTDVVQRVALQRFRILGHASRYQFEEAVGLTLEALSWVGVRIPQRLHAVHVAWALLRTTLRARRLTPADLRALPVSADPKVDTAMQLMADTTSVAYFCDPRLVPVLVCRMVDLSLDHGVSAATAFACAGWAFVLTQRPNGVEAALVWAGFARELAARFDDRRMGPRVEVLVLGFVESLTRPLGSLAEPVQRAGWAATEAGDAEFTALAAMTYTNFSFLGGVELQEVIRRGQASVRTCRELRQESATNEILLTLQAAECLSGRAGNPAVMSGSYADAEALNAHMERCGDRAGMALLLFHQVSLLLLFGDTASTIAAVEAATLRLGDIAGAPRVPAFLFHAALAWVRQMRETGQVRGRAWRQARKFQGELAALAVHCPENFAHKARLVEAELADVRGDVARAQLLYEDAIRLAAASGMVMEQAICLEWAGEAAKRFGNRRLAAGLTQEARSTWEAWGAIARVRALDGAAAAAELPTEASSSSIPRPGASSDVLEFAAVLKAARAVSGEIQLTELLRTLMQTIFENAGATWGMLVLANDTQLLVAARGQVEASGRISVVVHDVRVPVTEERPFADAIVRDVARTRTARLVHDGASDSRYFAGVTGAPRSVYCLPVRRGRNLVGVMYLENDLTRSAFNDARSDVVGMLCAQAAVSIENASLYTDLRAAHDRLALVSRQLVEAQEVERRAIARELHDETGQLLTALALHLDLAATGEAGGGGERVATIRAARELVGDLIRRVRRISLDLRPFMLDDLGLLPALLWLIDRYTGHTSVRVDLVHAGLDRRFPAPVETAAFRIVQEGLTNVARHAGVGSAAVSVSAAAGNLSIEVTDRGTGFDHAVPSGTTAGLSGMRERATLLGGRFELESGPGGTTLVVELPFGGQP